MYIIYRMSKEENQQEKQQDPPVDYTEWEGVPDANALTKEEKYDKLMEARRRTINRYHRTAKGIEARQKASTKYYNKNREKILARKRAKYASKHQPNKNGKVQVAKDADFHNMEKWKVEGEKL
jgi:hypothetical protein